MRFLIGILIFVSLFGEIFAEESYLPESANPKTYRKISECYAHDDITFYTVGGGILGDWKDWKNIKIFEDGCFSKLGNRMYYAGEYFSYWDNKKSESMIVIPDNTTFHMAKFQSGILLGVDQDFIFHGNVALKIPTGFDISNMKYLQYGYMTDGTSLYYIGSADGTILRIEGIDIPSFGVFKSPMGKSFLYDKYGAYNDSFIPSKQRIGDEGHISYINVKEMKSYENYDFKSLTESGVFVFDTKNVYAPEISVPVDISSFGLFPDDQLARDKNHIFTPTGKVIEGIDIGNYEYIGNGVVRSRGKLFTGCKNEVGCDGYELIGFDVPTFRKTLSGFADKNGNYDLYFNSIDKSIDRISYSGSTSYYHAGNKIFAYVNGDFILLADANIDTFIAFSGTFYAKDSSSCWFEGSRFSCNAKTFKALEAWRALDGRNVYYQDKKIPGADPKSFTGIDTGGYNWIETYHYMQDKKRVYYDDRTIINSDPKTFILMKDLHSKDKNNIYYVGWKIEGADYKTYTLLRYSFARDKNHFYFAGIVLDRIRNPKGVKIMSRDMLQYNGKIQYYWCLNSKADQEMCE